MNQPRRAHRVRSCLHQVILMCLWVLARLILWLPIKTKHRHRNVLLVHCDADNLIGSRGDEAMTRVTIARVRQLRPAHRLFVTCTTPAGDLIARSIGMEPMRIWGGLFMPFKFLRKLAGMRPEVGLIMGADVMDGHYSPVIALRMIIAADLLARTGAQTAFLGFSMNQRPAPLLKYAFRLLHRRVTVNLRDPLSLERFKRFTGRDARLVADCAFLLEPQPLTPAAAAGARWIDAQRAAGRTVVALNFHPLLYRSDLAEKRLEHLVDALLAAMRALAGALDLSWFLLPHDNRPNVGDRAALSSLYTRLSEAEKAYCYLLDMAPSAAEIKSLVAGVDGVVAGRMHLAIAALGRAVPVLVIDYQGKFAGLCRHFSLPQWLVMQADSAADPANLVRDLGLFVGELPALKARIGQQLPAVAGAAESTFAGVLERALPAGARVVPPRAASRKGS